MVRRIDTLGWNRDRGLLTLTLQASATQFGAIRANGIPGVNIG